MKYLDLTLPTPHENLACDEALLDSCEEGFSHEILRLWEPREYFVVLGYSNKAKTEVLLSSCKRHRIPVLRRPSGGGTVLQGPGCLNFSLILKIPESGPLKNLAGTNRHIMESHKKAFEPLLKKELKIQGTSDLTLNNLKFSGNAQRRKRSFFLFHGTFLLDFDIPLIGKFLKMPSKEPDYRRERPHTEFLTNLYLSSSKIKKAIRDCWEAASLLKSIPQKKIEELVREKYLRDSWNLKF